MTAWGPGGATWNIAMIRLSWSHVTAGRWAMPGSCVNCSGMRAWEPELTRVTRWIGPTIDRRHRDSSGPAKSQKGPACQLSIRPRSQRVGYLCGPRRCPVEPSVTGTAARAHRLQGVSAEVRAPLRAQVPFWKISIHSTTQSGRTASGGDLPPMRCSRFFRGPPGPLGPH